MTLTAHIDFADPHDRSAPRLRQAFGAPREVLQAHQLQDVRAVLDAVHAAAQRGHWCVGHVRYEAAAAFDAALQTHAADGPLAWFAVYDAPLPWPADGSADAADPAAQVEWTGGPDRAGFDAAIAHIQQAISAGELYQVNYTAPLTGSLRQGSAAALFAALQRAQPGGYAAHMAAGPEQVLSVSPELFFDWHDAPGGGRILARPMKGTAARGATPADDAAQAAHLRASPKERAENVMIVDLLRNDLSRIAQPHSVRVPALFHTEGLPTVWQMTSDVQARTRAGIRLSDVFAALFPCGSVTGAPKVRAMQMIRALESAPRGVYCGAVGVVRPAGVAGPDGLCSVAATFNVPIRTVVLRAGADGATTATCGIGSGQPHAEAFALHPTPEPVRLQLAGRPLPEAHGEFVRYKTTRRAHYTALAPTTPGVFDTVLWNEAGEITETTFGNIAMLLDGRWVTPPLACGLLPGVGRAVALREGRLTEAVVRLQDLPRVQAWAFVNSLRGWLAAELVP